MNSVKGFLFMMSISLVPILAGCEISETAIVGPEGFATSRNVVPRGA
jgi:hypothetical protein